MSNELTTMTTNSIKNFWQRPEGTAGKITLVAGSGAAIYGAYLALPIVLVAAQTALYAYAMIAGIGLTIAVVTNHDVRRGVAWRFKKAMQILFAVPALDQLKEAIQVGLKKSAKAEEGILESSKAKRSLQGFIEVTDKDGRDALALAKQCQKQNRLNEFTVHMANAKRLKEASDLLHADLSRLENGNKVLRSMKEQADLKVQNLQNTVAVQERLQKARSATNKSFKLIFSITQDPEQKYVVDQALERLADEANESWGELDHYMEIADKIRSSAELQNAADRDEGMRLLEEWSKKPSLLLGSEKTVLMSEAANDAAPVTIEATAATPKKNDYSNLIDNH